MPMTALSLPLPLQDRLTRQGPIRTALIGAGKFASMFLAQLPTSPHIRLTAIADLDPERARKSCRQTGLDAGLLEAVGFYNDALEMIEQCDAEVVIDATGHPLAGIAHARAAAHHGRHIVMANVEADVLAGPALAAEAQKAGTVNTMAYGDQPALICELVDWARTCGFAVIAAGKGTAYQPAYHASTPDDIWGHYGIDAETAAAAGMNPKMFNSFLDGTKSAIEMAALANATGLNVPADGLKFPPCGQADLARVLCPRQDGGVLDGKGYVEVVASSERGAGQELADHLRWGVYVVIEAPNDYARACFGQYGIRTDQSGRYAALYRPFHFIGQEIGISVVSAALNGAPTGQSRSWRGDVVAVAKRDLPKGTELDGEGGYCVWGRLMPAAQSLRLNALPIGLAHGAKLSRPVAQGQVLTMADPDGEIPPQAREIRHRMAASLG